jgi:ssDNA-binding replication factor A large subunit
MKVTDLKANNNFDEIVLKIVEKDEPREITSMYRGTVKVCNMVGEDEDGERIQLTLWNKEIEMVDLNDTVKISDGWVKEWDNKLQISTGRNGKIEKI